MRASHAPAGVAEWQTRPTQNRLSVRTCGFDPHHRHRQASVLAVSVAAIAAPSQM